MNANDIRVGTKLEFEVVDNSGSKIGETYKSQFLEIKSSRKVIIGSPIHEYETMVVSSGNKIKGVFVHENDNLFSFEGTITKIEKDETFLLLHARIGDEFTKIQRRKYFRLESYHKTKYCLIDDPNFPNKSIKHILRYKKALIKNISFKGALLEIDENLSKDSIVDLIIWLKDKTNVKMRCRVLNSAEVEVRGMKKYDLNLFLVDINGWDKEILTKFITRNIILSN